MKKISPSIKGLLISLAVCFLAFGIYFQFLAKKNEYLVDNPTNNLYYFKINKGDQKTIAAGQSVKIDLQKGKNEIQVFNQNKELLYDSAFNVKKLR